MQETAWIWLNGELVPWNDARVHIASHGLHYGAGVFEGIRVYETEQGPAVFRLREHLERLEASARLLYMGLPFTPDQIAQGCLELVAANELDECYLRPLAFYSYGELGVHPGENPVDVAVMAWPWGAYLGEAAERGARLKISSYERVGPNVIPHAAKATGVYLNSMLATMEARRAGYDEALLLTATGSVADGAGENVFAVKDERLYTPALSASILGGITRETVTTLARAQGLEVVEAALLRSDLYLADEVFLTGTAVEVTPVKSVDDVELTCPGPVTRTLAARYQDAVHGRLPAYSHWLTPVPR